MIVGVWIRIVRVKGASKSSNHTLRYHHFDDAEVLGVRPPCAQTLADDLLEGVSKISAEKCVDARIDGRIAIAEPEQDGKQNRRDTLRTECPYNVHREERHPAHDETAHNDSYK